VPGVSEHISVVSVVGRFLEHSRVYAFERGEETIAYIGSADLMPRNLDTRVELLAPVLDEGLRAEVLEALELCLADNTNAWELGDDGAWERRHPDGEPRNAQRELMARHAARAAETAPA
jgi:polyphosphate kinase